MNNTGEMGSFPTPSLPIEPNDFNPPPHNFLVSKYDRTQSKYLQNALMCNGTQRAKIIEKVHKLPLVTLVDARVKKGDHV